MITIRPFAAYRPVADKVAQVASLPYDVMNEEEAKQMVGDNPYSFLRVDKPEIQFPNLKGETLYQKAGEILQKMIEDGIYIQDKPCLYIYGLTNAYTTQYGLVCCVDAKEYDKGLIKKHEKTRTDKEQERILHVQNCEAHTGPIFLAYKNLDDVTNWMMNYVKTIPALYNFVTEDGVKHEVYQIAHEEEIAFVVNAFKEANALYIADGHHRAAAAAAVAKMPQEAFDHSEEQQYFLATIFPKEHLYIMDYNRVLQDESGLTCEQLFDKLSLNFTIDLVEDEFYQPKHRHTFGMRYAKKWYTLTLKEGMVSEKNPVESLDVAILQRYVLDPIFHIQNPKEDKRIDFIGGIRGIEELNHRTNEDMDIAFSLYPTSMDELMNVADANELMPPKSTWFEPKLRSGIFIHTI